MDHHHPVIKNIEKKTGIDMRKVQKLGGTLQNGDFRDEKQMRSIVRQLGSIAGKKPSKNTEEMIISFLKRNWRQS